MQRRTFLLAGAGVLTAFVGGWRALASSQHEVVMQVLRKRLSYLRLDEAGLRRFAADMVARDIISPVRLHALGAMMPFYQHLALAGREGWLHSMRHGEERIITLFLMSSDFFAHGAREDRTVHYLDFYDARNNPMACSNPFARPVVAFDSGVEKGLATLPAAAAATAAR
jgi:hypothetical protein